MPQRLAFALLVCSFAHVVSPSAAEVRAEKSTDVNGDPAASRVHTLDSRRQRAETRVRVLLPDSFVATRKYRVLYLLPVEAATGTRYGDGLAEAKHANLHNRFDLICVAPDFADLPWYADHPTDDRLQQETYFIEDVLKLIEAEYPVVKGREGRLLVGFSKSGWGAFSLLLRHPNRFAKAAAWDAPLMKDAPDQFGMGPIFGTQKNFERYQLTELLRAKGRELGKTTRLIHLGYGNFREHHASFEQVATEIGVPHLYRDGPKRKHVWGSGWLEEAVGLLVAEPPESSLP